MEITIGSFIAAGEKKCTQNEYVPAPYFRKSVTVEKTLKKATFTICGLGFYRFWLNGKELTKGFLSPYICNPDNVLDYDEYDVTNELQQGKNVLAFLLGNGMQNSFGGGCVWEFDNASFRSAPKFDCRLQMEYQDGSKEEIVSDESFVTHDSPILCDDMRSGEIYDANDEIKDWNAVNFDDSQWKPAIKAQTPKGKAVICRAKPITVRKELTPVVLKFGKWVPGILLSHRYGYIYDFKINTTGIIKLRVRGTKGQKIVISFGEVLKDGEFYTDNLGFGAANIQTNVYICKGEGLEEYEPSFTYHGFRYAFVEGITPEQATEDLLVYKVMHTDLEERGNFSCSCDILNTLQKMTRNSTLSNFWHFPTDCPHREKNGWTGDAAVSAEHTLLNLDAYENYYEWMRHIRTALNEEGALPGIVPTGGWGFAWGNGPAWDQVIVELPYMSYRYTGKKEIVEDNIEAILKYVNYLATRRDEKGLVAIGLGDWDPPFDVKSPLIFTDSAVSMTIFEKASFLANLCGRTRDAERCASLAKEMKESIRTNLIDLTTCVAVGECQTSQSLAIYWGILQGEEKEKAFKKLLEYIDRDHRRLDVGIIGGRVLFHVLAENGYADLAYEMITAPTPPSYADWVKRGYTALPEDFWQDDRAIQSKNHHFWGDISAFFIKEICGIHYNPKGTEHDFVAIQPQFISSLDHAKAYHECPQGKICVAWERKGKEVELNVQLPRGMRYCLRLPQGYSELSKTQSQEGFVVRCAQNG